MSLHQLNSHFQHRIYQPFQIQKNDLKFSAHFRNQKEKTHENKIVKKVRFSENNDVKIFHKYSSLQEQTSFCKLVHQLLQEHFQSSQQQLIQQSQQKHTSSEKVDFKYVAGGSDDFSNIPVYHKVRKSKSGFCFACYIRYRKRNIKDFVRDETVKFFLCNDCKLNKPLICKIPNCDKKYILRLPSNEELNFSDWRKIKSKKLAHSNTNPFPFEKFVVPISPIRCIPVFARPMETETRKRKRKNVPLVYWFDPRTTSDQMLELLKQKYGFSEYSAESLYWSETNTHFYLN